MRTVYSVLGMPLCFVSPLRSLKVHTFTHSSCGNSRGSKGRLDELEAQGCFWCFGKLDRLRDTKLWKGQQTEWPLFKYLRPAVRTKVSLWNAVHVYRQEIRWYYLNYHSNSLNPFTLFSSSLSRPFFPFLPALPPRVARCRRCLITRERHQLKWSPENDVNLWHLRKCQWLFRGSDEGRERPITA